jgi:uncharacterized protein (DUF2141 family)
MAGLRLLSLLSAMLVSGVHVAQPAPAANTLQVVVSGVPSSRGHVRVDICPQHDFLTDRCQYSGAAPSQTGTTVVTIQNLPPGVYAAQAYHDKNDNNKVDRNLLGIPTENVGFSNDPPVHLHAPKFRSAAFTYPGGETSISLRLRHFGH